MMVVMTVAMMMATWAVITGDIFPVASPSCPSHTEVILWN
jgi:hypothetical protein